MAEKFNVGTINDEPTPPQMKPDTAYKTGEKVLAGPLYQRGFSSNGKYVDIRVSDYIYECIVAGTTNTDGTEFDTTEGNDSVSGTATFRCIGIASVYGDLKKICKRIWDVCPSRYIYFIIPIMNGSLDNGEDRISTFEAIINFCETYRLDYVNLQKKFTVNTINQNGYGATIEYLFNDALHLNDYGQRLEANILRKYF